MNYPLVSIVSGTYNRLTHLKEMVESARLSIGVGIPYEIILVDGGSTDGTQTWCKQQSDIVLIEQGELLGACRAFNAGFLAAHGHYIIIGNDDVVFVDESIRYALVCMEKNPSIGIGCFQQDRYGRDWHVEYMAAIKNGKQISVPYGQVCIVPKWLGDDVGWWSNFYRTYAGDNEISANVWEMGFSIEPIPCASIHDNVAQDELRKINAGDIIYQPKGHPDSLKWVSRWKQGKLLGPVIPEKASLRTDMTGLKRILYAPIYEPGMAIQKTSKKGLREALAKHYLVSEVDWVGNPDYIFDAANAWDPDIILTQFHGIDDFIKPSFVRELKEEHPRSVFINWNGDYFPENFFNPDYVKMMSYYDICGFVTDDVKDVYKLRNINWKYWQIGYEDSFAVPNKTTKHHDVVFLGNSHYDFRVELGKTLRSIKNHNVGLYGNWHKSYRPDGYNLYDYDEGTRIYKASKIAISDSRPDAGGFVSNRLFQAMIAGCFVIQQKFSGMQELNGLIDGKHLVTYKKTSELLFLLDYWLDPVQEIPRKMIAEEGRKFVQKNCSFDARVFELTKWINELSK